MSKEQDVLTMSVDDLKKRLTKAREHLSEIEDLLPGLLRLTPDARKHSAGKFRAGEADALGSVLDAAEKKPALFESLAALDDGFDPKKFETNVLRDRLTRVSLIEGLATEIEGFAGGLDDTTLHLGDLSRPVMLSAYDIARSHAKHDGAVASAASRRSSTTRRLGAWGLRRRGRGARRRSSSPGLAVRSRERILP